MTDSTSPRIYVGTYGKYASGSIAGKWLDLDDYADRDAFLAACKELHKDEADPELMFQDFEGFPRAFYNESSAPPAEFWDWLDLDDDDKELLEAFADEHWSGDGYPTIETARESYVGRGDSERDIVETYFEETGGLSEVPEYWRNHIDFDSVVRDWKAEGTTFTRHGGTVYAFGNY
jgi:antirestriction protein